MDFEHGIDPEKFTFFLDRRHGFIDELKKVTKRKKRLIKNYHICICFLTLSFLIKSWQYIGPVLTLYSIITPFDTFEISCI